MNGMAGQRATARKVLVACVGNPDRGDDGIGAMVAAALIGRLPADTTLLARSGDMMSLIHDWAGFDALVCVDAAAPMGAPGRIHRIDLAMEELPAGMAFTSSHSFGLADAIHLASALQCAPQDIVVYAVEGRCFDGGKAMTAEVAAAADEVAQRIVDEVDRLRQPRLERARDTGIAKPGVITENATYVGADEQ
jgi:hydrogenase maturation protease